MRNRAAIWLCVGFGALAVVLPLGRLLAQEVSIGEPLPGMPSASPGVVAPGPDTRPPTVIPPAPTVTETRDTTPQMIVNSRKIRLNYKLTDLGPSGVSAVELWATRDGQTWQCYSNEPPPDGPLVVHVAEEGRYGFYLVVKSGVGAKSPAPKKGEKAQVWVEVDETAPVVKLSDVRVGKGADEGLLLVHWSATDARLTPRPVTISMAPGKDGPWAPIGTAIENAGRYAWQMPKDMPYQFFVKVEAVDQAGNVGAACTHEPVKVDMARPKGLILGVDHDKKAEPTPDSVSLAPVLSEPVTRAR